MGITSLSIDVVDNLWWNLWIKDTYWKWFSIVWNSNSKKIIAPIFKGIECTFVGRIVDENYAISITIKCWTQSTEAFLSSGIPNLQSYVFVVDLYLFEHEIDTNVRLKYTIRPKKDEISSIKLTWIHRNSVQTIIFSLNSWRSYCPSNDDFPTPESPKITILSILCFLFDIKKSFCLIFVWFLKN